MYSTCRQYRNTKILQGGWCTAETTYERGLTFRANSLRHTETLNTTLMKGLHLKH